MEVVKDYWEKRDFSFPVYHSLDILELLHAHHLPIALIIDGDGNIYRRYTGTRPIEVFLKDLESLKKEATKT